MAKMQRRQGLHVDAMKCRQWTLQHMQHRRPDDHRVRHRDPMTRCIEALQPVSHAPANVGNRLASMRR